jgi:hypothetical protein
VSRYEEFSRSKGSENLSGKVLLLITSNHIKLYPSNPISETMFSFRKNTISINSKFYFYYTNL